MEQGYIENGFIVDVSNAKKTSEIIYQLSTILDLPDAHCKKVCLKLGDIELSTTELVSIKALVESMNSEIEFVSSLSSATIEAAVEVGLKVSDIENKVPTPDFNQNVEEAQQTNQELEKALDKIFGDSDLSEQTFSTNKEIKKLQDASQEETLPVLTEFKTSEEDTSEEVVASVEPEISEVATVTEPEFSEQIVQQADGEEDLKAEFAEFEDFNRQLEKVNRETKNSRGDFGITNSEE